MEIDGTGVGEEDGGKLEPRQRQENARHGKTTGRLIGWSQGLMTTGGLV